MDWQHLLSLHYVWWPLFFLVSHWLRIIIQLLVLRLKLLRRHNLDRMKLIWQYFVAYAVYLQLPARSDKIDFNVFVFNIAVGTRCIVVSFECVHGQIFKIIIKDNSYKLISDINNMNFINVIKVILYWLLLTKKKQYLDNLARYYRFWLSLQKICY